MTPLLADIAHGNVDAADVFFLVALILAVVAVVAALTPPAAKYFNALIGAAIASLSLAWLLL